MKAASGHVEASRLSALILFHLRAGWFGLFVFLALGLVLESFHGLKLGMYLDLRHETRRLLWTLAHSHGTLLSLMNIALGLTLPYLPSTSRLSIISWTMVLAQWILPLGFFLGGAWPKGGDPSLWIVLVPLGGFFLLVSTLLIVYNLQARLARTHTGATPSQSPP